MAASNQTCNETVVLIWFRRYLTWGGALIFHTCQSTIIYKALNLFFLNCEITLESVLTVIAGLTLKISVSFVERGFLIGKKFNILCKSSFKSLNLKCVLLTLYIKCILFFTVIFYVLDPALAFFISVSWIYLFVFICCVGVELVRPIVVRVGLYFKVVSNFHSNFSVQ